MERKDKRRALVDTARQMLEKRGEKTVLPQMNPVVRKYVRDLDEGLMDDPSDFAEAIDNFRSDFLFEMFPEEYAQMEAQAIAAAQAKAQARGPRPSEQMIRMPMPIEGIGTQAPVRAPKEMNQGGMMYDEIMRRPMFQTPQMREGSGIMAGVAPIRGYAEGDLVTGGITGGRSQAAQDDDEIVETGTADELASKLFGEGGILFDTDAPVQSTLMALTIPLGGGLLGLTARGLMMARRASQAAKAAKTADKADDIQSIYPYAPVTPSTATGAAATGTAAGAGIMGGRMASAIRRNPKTSAAAGIAALGLGTPALIGEDEEGKPVVDDQPPPEQPPPPPPDPTFLDMLRGAGSRVLEGLQDPATRYALAKAAQPSEGVVPRNFFSDFVIGQEEYKQLEAQREDDTALMRNYEFLRETTDLSPKEIIDRLSGGESPREQFISLFEVGQASGRTSPEDILRFATLSGYKLTDEDKKTFGITDKAQQPSADLD